MIQIIFSGSVGAVFDRSVDTLEEDVMQWRLWLCAAFLVGVGNAALADDTEAGKTLYVHNCQRCHGPKGAQLDQAAYWAPDLFKRAVLTGVNAQERRLSSLMPRWGTVGLTDPKGRIPSDEDLSDIQAYLRTLIPKS